VLANGNVSSAPVAAAILQETGARGLMIGRGAVRNPWIFSQIRQQLLGRPVAHPTGREVLAYVHALYEAVCTPGVAEGPQVQKMKKYANFIGAGVDPSGRFLHDIRRATRREEFFQICERAMDHDEPMPLETFAELPGSAG
jgi:tRNA-dihydrouridine synthase